MQKKYLFTFSLLAALYIFITVLIPPDPTTLAKYNISALQTRLLSLTFILPIMAIWYAAFYGFSKFKSYAASIQADADGKALNTLANGLMVAALSLPISSIVSTTLNYVRRGHTNLTPHTVIFTNYLNLLIAVLTYYFIYQGAKSLVKLVNKRFEMPKQAILTVVYIILGALYTYLVLHSSSTNVAADTTVPATYYSPNWVIVTTQLVPYLCVWYAGILATRMLNFYQKNVKGSIYKESLNYLSKGILGIIFISIVVQLFKLFSDQLSHAYLSVILGIIYVLIIVLAVAYLMIALGAKRLKKIEEV